MTSNAARVKRYRQSAKGRATRLACKRRYEKTPNGIIRKKAHAKKWYKRHSKAVRYRQILYKYGLTTVQFNDLLRVQGYRCAVCKGTKAGTKNRDWAVDHCHKTGKIRGLLCQGCNTALGATKDNPSTLRGLADYLERDVAHFSIKNPAIWGNVACLG